MTSSRFATALIGCLPSALAHGFIEFPPLRGGTAGRPANAYCPHCGNGAGICGDGGQWGTDSDLLNFARGPVTRLRPGETAEFSVKITAHHKGFFEFRICDQHLDGSVTNPQACLNQHLLQRAPPAADCSVNDGRGDCQPLDARHPERWYLPPGAGTYKMKYEIPADLRCTSCTLQWEWFTANSCIPGEDTGCYWADFAAQGWDRAGWCGSFCGRCSSLLESNSSSRTSAVRGCGEEFRNCADIAVVEDGAEIPVVDDENAGPIATPSTDSESPSSGSSQQGSCSAVWGQCGGKNFQGPYCCAAGSGCVEQSEWYSQCQPGAETPTTGSDATSSEQMPQTSATTAAPVEESTTASSEEPHSEPESEPETESEAEAEHEGSDGSSSSAAPPSSSTPVSGCDSCRGCMWSNGFCCKDASKSACESHLERTWCGVTTQTTTQTSSQPSACGSCMGCMWSNGLCYMDASKSYCESWSDNTWCGASLAQVKRHTSKFLGLGLIQDGAWAARSVIEEL